MAERLRPHIRPGLRFGLVALLAWTSGAAPSAAQEASFFYHHEPALDRLVLWSNPPDTSAVTAVRDGRAWIVRPESARADSAWAERLRPVAQVRADVSPADVWAAALVRLAQTDSLPSGAGSAPPELRVRARGVSDTEALIVFDRPGLDGPATFAFTRASPTTDSARSWRTSASPGDLAAALGFGADPRAVARFLGTSAVPSTDAARADWAAWLTRLAADTAVVRAVPYGAATGAAPRWALVTWRPHTEPATLFEHDLTSTPSPLGWLLGGLLLAVLALSAGAVGHWYWARQRSMQSGEDRVRALGVPAEEVYTRVRDGHPEGASEADPARWLRDLPDRLAATPDPVPDAPPETAPAKEPDLPGIDVARRQAEAPLRRRIRNLETELDEVRRQAKATVERVRQETELALNEGEEELTDLRAHLESLETLNRQAAEALESAVARRDELRRIDEATRYIQRLVLSFYARHRTTPGAPEALGFLAAYALLQWTASVADEAPALRLAALANLTRLAERLSDFNTGGLREHLAEAADIEAVRAWTRDAADRRPDAPHEAASFFQQLAMHLRRADVDLGPYFYAVDADGRAHRTG